MCAHPVRTLERGKAKERVRAWSQTWVRSIRKPTSPEIRPSRSLLQIPCEISKLLESRVCPLSQTGTP